MGIPEAILRALDVVVLPSGYERRKSLYHRRRDGNIAVLHFVGGADPEFARIDGHVGVQSGRLSTVFGPKMSVMAPGLGGPHQWQRWVGDLRHTHQPTSGWAVHLQNGEWDLSEIVRDLTRAVLPVLETHSRDEGLRDDWLRNPDTWLSEAQQVAYLIVLVRDLGPAHELVNLRVRLRELVASGDREAERLAQQGFLDAPPR